MDLRLLRSSAEYAACEHLQRETWGARFADLVPATVLKITNRVGGVAAGAFEGDQLVGFVYGITGVDAGRLVHWSHLLAVRPAWRNRGVGRRLKEFQRELLVQRGVEAMLWSFDPLVARNAHLNLNLLGCRVLEYVEDMYPDSKSDLHAFGTDRFVVEWDLRQATPPRNGRAHPPAASSVWIEVPDDIHTLAERSLDEARAWRRRTRAAFTEHFARGYHVADFRAQPGHCAYLLLPASPPERP